MIVLGVDPGIRNTGWAVLDDNKVKGRGVIEPPGEGRLLVCEVLNWTLPRIAAIISKFSPSIASVEEVTWYGRGRRITLPLSHVAGAIIGILVGAGIPTYTLIANMKKGALPRGSGGWTEHEKDSVLLALVAAKAEAAFGADASSIPRSLSAAVRRRITIARNVRGQP